MDSMAADPWRDIVEQLVHQQLLSEEELGADYSAVVSCSTEVLSTVATRTVNYNDELVEHRKRELLAQFE